MEMGPIGFPKTLVQNYHSMLCKIPEEGGSHDPVLLGKWFPMLQKDVGLVGVNQANNNYCTTPQFRRKAKNSINQNTWQQEVADYCGAVHCHSG
jgi:hypothetical protein